MLNRGDERGKDPVPDDAGEKPQNGTGAEPRLKLCQMSRQRDSLANPARGWREVYYVAKIERTD